MIEAIFIFVDHKFTTIFAFYKNLIVIFLINWSSVAIIMVVGINLSFFLIIIFLIIIKHPDLITTDPLNHVNLVVIIFFL